MTTTTRAPLSVIFGCAGPVLTPEEADFFSDANPWGFILFGRSCETPAQIRALVSDLRACVGRDDAPVLIDQEGGPVQRLTPPHWQAYPAAARFGALYARDKKAACDAVEMNARLIAFDLHALGINVDCMPVLDLPQPDAHPVIGARGFAQDADAVIDLARHACAGLRAGGVVPVLKHMPGHGRARADSHETCPVVEASAECLKAHDFRPFAALAADGSAHCAMTAHIVYAAFDAGKPATLSPTVIQDVMRNAIGFDGLLISDDIGMKALDGSWRARTRAALDAGCDMVLHCSGNLDEMREVAAEADRLDAERTRRTDAALDALRPPALFSPEEGRATLERLLENTP